MLLSLLRPVIRIYLVIMFLSLCTHLNPPLLKIPSLTAHLQNLAFSKNQRCWLESIIYVWLHRSQWVQAGLLCAEQGTAVKWETGRLHKSAAPCYHCERTHFPCIIHFNKNRSSHQPPKALTPWVEKPKSSCLLTEKSTLSLSSIIIIALHKHL